jgi:hypothetical protein
MNNLELKHVAAQIHRQSLTLVLRELGKLLMTPLSNSVEKQLCLSLDPNKGIFTFSQFGPMWDGMSLQMYAARIAVTDHMRQREEPQ